MKSKIDFYYNPHSRGRTVHWMLEECEANYEIKTLKWESSDHKSETYLKINPMGKIPSIVYDNTAVTETAAICTFLADMFPEKNLAPKVNDKERGTYYRWLFFAASNIEPAMLDKDFPRQNSPKASFLGHGSREDVFKTLQLAVKNGYLVQNKFTAADLFLSANLEYGMHFGLIDQFQEFKDYVNLCTDRPSYNRFIDQAGTF